MGLDIYFKKRRKGTDDSGEHVAYFRKVNFILPFFGYDDNLSELAIGKEKVAELVDACNVVLRDTAKSDETLPTRDGFFFGNTDYNEDYIQDVRKVLKEFNSILHEFDFDRDELYMFCWW